MVGALDAEPLIGKIDQPFFEHVIQPRLGEFRSEVLAGPKYGTDCAIVDIGDGRVMAVSCDPFFVLPELGWERAAWLGVNIVASDAATSGVDPAYCSVSLHLPLSTSDEDLSALWRQVHESCKQVSLSIVAGHTGRYEGSSFPIIGAMTVWGFGSSQLYLTPKMSQPGDTLILTKGAAIETTALFGTFFETRLSTLIGETLARASANLFDQLTVVRDASIATRIGVRDAGVTAMHDAAERGVWGALHELAHASELGLIVDMASVPVLPSTAAICDLFGIDPFTASTHGTLIITCRPSRAPETIERLQDAGIIATVVGEMAPSGAGVRVVSQGREQDLPVPTGDPFWPAFTRARMEWK